MNRIITHYDHPPIPTRSCDWSATFEGYEGGDLIGRGESEREAIEDLLCLWAEK